MTTISSSSAPSLALGADQCNILQITKEAFVVVVVDDGFSPIEQCAVLCVVMTVLVFIVSSLTHNYSQVDKLWSILPFLYPWIVVCDERTAIMAVVTTIWGLRLTYNFYRRGGYKWPPWDGDEDYRWKYIQEGYFVKILQNKLVWVVFNFGFISLFQNILLFLIAAPSVVAYLVATNCARAPLNSFDIAATLGVLCFIVIETMADNQQWKFQNEKYRLRKSKEPCHGEYADGFKQSGLYAIVRKPNYASEQVIWVSFYLYSVAAVEGRQWINWSLSGCVLLMILFQGSGWFTELITQSKYPKYKEYMKKVPLYVPNLWMAFRQSPKKDE